MTVPYSQSTSLGAIASMPVSLLAVPLEAYTLDVKAFRPGRLQRSASTTRSRVDVGEDVDIEPGVAYHVSDEHLMARLLAQGVLPMVSPGGLLEGVLLDYALLANHVLARTPPQAISVQLNLPLLLQEARRALVSLNVRQTVLDAQTLLYVTQYPLIPIIDDQGCYSGQAVCRKKLFELLMGKAPKTDSTTGAKPRRSLGASAAMAIAGPKNKKKDNAEQGIGWLRRLRGFYLKTAPAIFGRRKKFCLLPYLFSVCLVCAMSMALLLLFLGGV